MTCDSSLEELVRGSETCTFQQRTFYVLAVTHTVDILNHIDISKSQWHLFNNYVILCTLKFFKAVAPLLLVALERWECPDFLTHEGPVRLDTGPLSYHKISNAPVLYFYLHIYIYCWRTLNLSKKFISFRICLY